MNIADKLDLGSSDALSGGGQEIKPSRSGAGVIYSWSDDGTSCKSMVEGEVKRVAGGANSIDGCKIFIAILSPKYQVMM